MALGVTTAYEGYRLSPQQLLAAHRRQPFDLTADPPLRATLTRLDDRRHVLAITTPSLCADAASLSILLQCAARVYRGRRPSQARRTDPMPGSSTPTCRSG